MARDYIPQSHAALAPLVARADGDDPAGARVHRRPVLAHPEDLIRLRHHPAPGVLAVDVAVRDAHLAVAIAPLDRAVLGIVVDAGEPQPPRPGQLERRIERPAEDLAEPGVGLPDRLGVAWPADRRHRQ